MMERPEPDAGASGSAFFRGGDCTELAWEMEVLPEACGDFKDGRYPPEGEISFFSP